MATPRRALKGVVDVRREKGFVVAEKLECGCWLDLKVLGLKPGKQQRRCPTHNGALALHT